MKTILASFLLVLLAAATLNAATVTPVASGLNAAIGQAYSLSQNAIYFVQWNSGEVSKLDLAMGAVRAIHTGLTQPEGIALLPGYDLAYVTTRDGRLWKLSTNSADRGVVASGLGAPHAIVIDPSAFVAYVTDFSGGNLWRVDLGSGASTPIVTGLRNPLGLLLSADFRTAYVAEPDRILSISLDARGVRTKLLGGLTNAFFMDWANDARTAIYYVERDPANRVSRLDLTTGTSSLIANVAWCPSSVVQSADPNAIYVASDKFIERVSIAGSGGPVITRVGFIPSTSINAASGQATTDVGYFPHVKNASFGGTLHVMMNFPGMRSTGASYYQVLLDGATSATPEIASWLNHWWDGSRFRLETVLPTFGFYRVPSGSERWAIPDWGFALDSTRLTNGRHVLRVKLYDGGYAPLPVAEDQVALLIDNEKPVVGIDRIDHDGASIGACALVTGGTSTLAFTFSAYDPQAHLYSYALTDSWGSNSSYPVAGEPYIGAHDGSPTWFGVTSRTVLHDLTSTSTSCAHAFTLSARGNTTDGYNYIHFSSTTVHLAVYLGGKCS